MITAASLRSQTSKDLAQMARKQGVAGWHSMRKEQLIRTLLKLSKEKPAAKTATKAKAVKTAKAKSNGQTRAKTTRSQKSITPQQNKSRIARQIREERARRENLKDLALINSGQLRNEAPQKDRVIAVVRDSYWLQAYWEITKQTVARARTAMADSWHHAKPVLRVLEVEGDTTTNSVENIVREIAVHGGVRNWFIDVLDPPKSYRIALGYLADDGQFHLIAKSNRVTTPAPGANSFDDNWADITADYERYYAMSGGYDSNQGNNELQLVFEEKIKRPMNAPAFVRLGSGIGAMNRREFPFEVDAYMVVQGATDPSANVTLGGEPVRLDNDGTFCVRMELPDRRQVLPVVACSRDGTEQRTTVLAVERNTKVMEPISRDVNEVIS